MIADDLSLQRRQSLMVICVGLLALLIVLTVAKVAWRTPAEQQIARGVHYYIDDSDTLKLEQILALDERQWSTEQTSSLSYGMSSSPHWFHLRIEPSSDLSQRMLEVDYALLDYLDVWFLQEDTLLSAYHAGDTQAFDARGFLYEKFIFDVPQLQDETQVSQQLDVIIRIKNSGIVKLPLRLWKQTEFTLFYAEHSLSIGLFFGFLACMCLNNFFLFVTTRSSTFLYYSAFVFCLGMTLAILHGFAYKFLWPESPWWQARAVSFFANAAILFGLAFSNSLLNLEKNSALLHRLVRYFAVAFAVGGLATFFVAYSVLIKIFLIALSAVVVFVFAMGLWLWWQGVKLARLYTLAWAILLVSAFTASLENLGWLKLTIPSQYLLMFGAAIETFLLAMVLAISYSQQRQELIDSQQNALQQERDVRAAQDKVIQVQNEAQEELEYKVQERTLELEIALRELSESNRELEQKNTTDALTGIKNRRFFDKKLVAESRRSRREQTELALVILDIDHFKQVNDKYGHIAGDECLRFVAATLQNSLKRSSDDACRYGGEEFAIILPNTDLDGAMQLVESARQQIEQTPIPTSVGEVKVTISAGISSSIMYEEANEALLLQTADQCLYQAKAQGRNRTVAQKLSRVDNAINQE